MKTEAEIMRVAARWLLDNGHLGDDHSDDCDRSGDRDCCEAQRCRARLLNDPDVAGSAAREAIESETKKPDTISTAEHPIYIAMTASWPGYWGRGETVYAAKAKAKAAGARGKRAGNWVVKRMPPGAVNPYVNDAGAICWKWEESVPDEARAALPETIESPKQQKGAR